MLSRRDFLQTIPAIASVPILAKTGDAFVAHPEWIDAHVHVWTPDTEKYPLSPRFKKSDMVPASFTPEELFAHCQPEAVTRVVLIQMSFYEFDNRYMLDCIARYKGVFAGVGIIDETQPRLEETMKSMASQGVRGFRLYTDKQKASAWQDSSGMKTMWSYGADAGLAMCLLANPDALPMVHAMCQRYPKTPVVIDHFARIGISGAIDAKDLDNLCRLAAFENVYVKTSAFYALGAKKAPYRDLGPMIERLVKEFGSHRLMWASDCPYQVGNDHTYADSIALIRSGLDFLSDRDKKNILRDTAAKLFFGVS